MIIPNLQYLPQVESFLEHHIELVAAAQAKVLILRKKGFALTKIKCMGCTACKHCTVTYTETCMTKKPCAANLPIDGCAGKVFTCASFIPQ